MNTPKRGFALATCLVGCALFSSGGAEARSLSETHVYARQFTANISRNFGVLMLRGHTRDIYREVVDGGDGTVTARRVLATAGHDPGSGFACEWLMRSRVLAESKAFNISVDDDILDAAVVSTCY